MADEPHERKFLLSELAFNEIVRDMEVEFLIAIEQFQERCMKFRKGYYLLPENMKYVEFYHEYIRIGKFFHMTELTEGEWEAAKELVKQPETVILRKRRYVGHKDGYDLDVDQFFHPTKLFMLEVSSKDKPLKDFIPSWSVIKEVTDDPAYKNVNIAAGSLKESQ